MTARSLEKARGYEDLSVGDDSYGIYREKPKKETHDGGWRVCVQRRGKVVQRHFKDSVYGSSEAALEQAKAFRDAVMEVLPPMTNREHAVQLRRNNKTGVAGIYRGVGTSGPYWQAHMHIAVGARTRKFAVGRYGEDGAKALAVAQRQQWLSEWSVEYFGTVSPYTKLNSHQLADQSNEDPDVLPHDMPKAEIEARLAAINARFDDLRPARLRVGVSCLTLPKKRMEVLVSDAGQLARKRQMTVGLRKQTLVEALGKARSRIELTITEFYNADVAHWFTKEHADKMLDSKCFDPDVGMRILVLVPRDMMEKPASDTTTV